MKPIYLVVGVPGSGKTWVCEQLGSKFNYLPHDEFIDEGIPAYVNSAARLAEFSETPVLIETPFSVTQIREPLLKRKHTVIPVFIIEEKSVISDRYSKRDNKPIPQGHLTRIDTYITRANELKAFKGTSKEVLEFLSKI